MTYKESEYELNVLMNSNPILFRMAIFHLIDVGARNLTDSAVRACCKEIDKEDDSLHFMTNGYKKAIVETAAKLAKIDPVHLLVFIQRNLQYDVGDGVCLPNVMRAMDVLLDDLFYGRETASILAELQDARLTDEEIMYLGYGYCIPEKELED